MSFPQPSSTLPVKNGQDFFRLTTPLASAGDLYESEVGAMAFALGPESDIANVLVSYYDAVAPGGVSQFTISPSRTFVGTVAARNEEKYIQSPTRKGRILLSVSDLYDPTFRPGGSTRGGVPEGVPFDPAFDAIEFIAPTLDVVQYFTIPPSLAAMRSDKTYRFQYLRQAPQPNAGGVSWLAIPMYGRKSGYVEILNSTGATTTQVALWAARLSPGASGATITAAQALLDGPDDLLSMETLRFNYRASQHGLWDLLLIALGGETTGTPIPYLGGVFPITITLSDDPQ